VFRSLSRRSDEAARGTLIQSHGYLALSRANRISQRQFHLSG
jgi:hypothetical protein